MAYNKITVESGEVIESSWGNHIQTQYDEAVAYVDALTKDDIGLGNVINEEQATKSEFDSHVGDSDIHFEKGDVSKSDVGLGNVTNTEQVPKTGGEMTNKLTISNSDYKRHLDLKRGDNVAEINPSTGSNSGTSPELRFEGDMEGYWFDGVVKAEDGFVGDGSGLSGTASDLRAQATTKNDVGLGNVENVEQATKSEFDSHVGDSNIHFNKGDVSKSDVGLSNVLNKEQLGVNEKAVDSTLWDGYEIQVDGDDGDGIINFKTE